MFVAMCSVPHRPRLTPRQMFRAREHARLVCLDFETTESCKKAQEKLLQLEIRYDEQCRIDDMIKDAQIEKREYDA